MQGREKWGPHEVETWTSGRKGGGCSTVKEEGEDRHAVYSTAATRRGVGRIGVAYK